MFDSADSQGADHETESPESCKTTSTAQWETPISINKKWLGTAVTCAALALGPAGAVSAATAATATASITTSSSTCTSGGTQVFKQFGDPNDYVLAPNGTFLNGASGWTLTGLTAIVPDNDRFNLSSGPRYSLELGPGGTAMSLPFCVSSANPTFRYLIEPVFFGDDAETLVQVAESSEPGTTLGSL
jgi:hypothetical protein